MARRAQEAKLDYHEPAAGHDAMVTAPVELTRTLLDLAEGASTQSGATTGPAS